MTKPEIKLTTALACKVARLDRDRFNEAVAGGYMTCVPDTVAGRSRTFSPGEMLAPWYYRELIEDGYTRESAGRIACAITEAAAKHPDAPAISYVESYFGPASGRAFPADQVPDPSTWDKAMLSGTDIRKVTTFRVEKARALIAHYTAIETSVFGAED
ncbi:MAG: hypothetical protein Q8K33_19980 [Cypionkella sp.]|uniref:hypothetical protein n=1 Tax=Cypionkella sp. TaxID=2811411 RepID=UPI002731A78E|nr:hypothetical protein [Cypionkella sp.]MDP2051117.1 hypothetical protein [Cypionkella sp.]